MTRGRDYLTNNINDLYRQLNVIRRLDPYAASNYIRKAVGIDAYINEYSSKRGMDPGEAMDIMDDFMETAKEYESFPELFEYIDDYRREYTNAVVEVYYTEEVKGNPVSKFNTFH